VGETTNAKKDPAETRWRRDAQDQPRASKGLVSKSVVEGMYITDSETDAVSDAEMMMSDDSMDIIMQYMQAGPGNGRRGQRHGRAAAKAVTLAQHHGQLILKKGTSCARSIWSSKPQFFQRKMGVWRSNSQQLASPNLLFCEEIARAYAWVRKTTGAARRVTILFDSGVSHCYVHPRVLADLEIMSDSAVGPGTLRMADDHVIACKGTADGLQIFRGRVNNECNWWWQTRK